MKEFPNSESSQPAEAEDAELRKTESSSNSPDAANESNDSAREFDRRLGVLEERTKDKPKPIIDRVIAWGGVATFLLAVLYTFPLGVWDRFFVTPLDEERALITKLTDVDTEYFKTSQNLQMDQMLALSLSVRSKKVALILAKEALIKKWQNSLSGAEVEMLAYHAASVGEAELAQELFQTGLNKANAEKNAFLKADILRIRASMLAAPGTAFTDMTKARKDYNETVAASINLNQYYPAALAIWDWASYEESAGSKACAYFLAPFAIQMVASFEPNRAQLWSQAFQAARSADEGAHVQPTDACGKDIVNFRDKIRPGKLTPPAMSMSTSTATSPASSLTAPFPPPRTTR